jgi:hypothetical protein
MEVTLFFQLLHLLVAVVVAGINPYTTLWFLVVQVGGAAGDSQLAVLELLSQGFAGGDSNVHTMSEAGGGGGAGAVGAKWGDGPTSGNGGAGVAVAISGSSVTYAGGGGGGLRKLQELAGS